MNVQVFLWSMLGLAAGTYAMRLGGVLLRSRFQFSQDAESWIDRCVVALLIGVVVTSMGITGQDFVGFARVSGIGAAGIAVVLRAPLVLVLLTAVLVTGGLRLLGVP
ncbi:hypothetical protein GCM10009715_25960 [Paeniglutamicibacter psychrophenolicus]|uniref:Membrane protein n=1 Tax=Paeniglutamicibacter psychrophenolicus TaxID=257454 RepID=A0ABS4WEC9_9MICC|nr:AzlD domain-containing protein [Paeniglutamicibacter psychrophenolicus]MBP2374551.1 putative membrane protein [Paeniglutamicibacter psychrophenolicus]